MKAIQRIYVWVVFASILCLLSSCGSNNVTAFNGRKVADANHFDIDFEVLNTTYTHEIAMKENESIDVLITKSSGDISVLIQKDMETPIYKGDDVTSGEFKVCIKEAGIYTLSVSGKRAKGHVVFSRHNE